MTELDGTLRLPVRSAETLIAENRTLQHELAATRAALQSGSITYRHAQVIMQQAWSPPNDALDGFEQALLESAPHLTVSNPKHKARTQRSRKPQRRRSDGRIRTNPRRSEPDFDRLNHRVSTSSTTGAQPPGFDKLNRRAAVERRGETAVSSPPGGRGGST